MIPLRNRLGETASPYLLQHKDNPVEWYPWGEEALQAAKREDKPILLSIGYAACHWCHVMAHESFENPAIAELMNKLFINIKVDREERPDLDAIYQQALSLLGQQGGWPLTMFLLPDTQPFWGGTYFPPEARWGRPGFPEILTKIASLYQDEKDKVLSNSQQIMAAMAHLALPKTGDSISEDMLDRIAARLLQEMDGENGGVGSAPKFPHFPILELLWRAYLRNNKVEYKKAVMAALYAMLQGGIYDHLGGGMARYSVDAAWLIPHFEKMLYDNASLLSMLAMVQADVQDPIIAERAREIVAFLDNSMSVKVNGKAGAFASSWDADSEGEEGKYYVWQKSEIDHLLGEDSGLFCAHYGVNEEGNWEGTNILNRLGTMSWLGEETERKLAICRMKLEEARQKRIKPGFDDKILTDWNGMAITALCKAGFVFNEADWVALAKRAYKFLKDYLFMEGRLHHSWRNGQMGPMAHLDDQVQMAEAAFSLYETTGDEIYLSDVKARLEDLKREFRDPLDGGYFYTSIYARDIIIRQKSALDGATPNGNGLLLDLLLRMEQITGEGQYREEADILEKAFAGEIERSIFSLATFLNAIDFGYRPVSVVIYAEEEGRKRFLDICRQQFHPNLIMQWVNPGSELPPSHPAWGKTGIENRVFICKRRVCSMPISDIEAMEQALKSSYR